MCENHSVGKLVNYGHIHTNYRKNLKPQFSLLLHQNNCFHLRICEFSKLFLPVICLAYWTCVSVWRMYSLVKPYSAGTGGIS